MRVLQLKLLLGISLRPTFLFLRTLVSVPTRLTVTVTPTSTPFSLLRSSPFFYTSAMSTLSDTNNNINNKGEEKIQAAATPQQQQQEHDNDDEVEESEEEEKGVAFALSDTCTLKMVKGDITQWSVDGSSDAIVNAANERMLGGGGVDGAIHRAAGRELKEACYRVPEVKPGVRCPTGEARITPGFRLPAAYVIHTVGPVYDEYDHPEVLLQNAYRNSLRIAKENNIQYIAFPAISCGIYGYPFDEAAEVAISTVKEFADDFKEVHFVLFSDDIYEEWLKKGKEILE